MTADESPWTCPDARLLIFAKAPLPGQVKTRLQPALGARRAARLHARLVRRTVDLARKARLCPVELWCAPDPDHPSFQALARRSSITLRRQQGGDLGARMAFAAEAALSSGALPVVIGCDCPALTAADLRQVLGALSEGCDAVLGPAEDGGYVLIGLRTFLPALFRDMPWGSERVLAETRARLRAAGLRWCELAPRWDLDRPEDLHRLTPALRAELGLTAPIPGVSASGHQPLTAPGGRRSAPGRPAATRETSPIHRIKEIEEHESP